MDAVFQDVRYALRSLSGSRGYAAVAILSLAIGIGANTTAFSLVSAVLFRPLPYADADRLAAVYEHHPTEVCAGCGVGASYRTFVDLRETARSFSSLAAYAGRAFVLGADDGAQRVRGAAASAELFRVLGVEPARGRAFGPEEDRVGGERVVVIGHRLWERQFAADPGVVGRTIRLGGEPYTVVGVAPPGFEFPERAELWVPIAPLAAGEPRSERGVGVVGRLAPDATLAEAAAEVRALGRRLAAEHPETNAGWDFYAESLRDDLASDTAGFFWLLLGVVGFALLLACANLANLLLARAAGRRVEVAVRAALGASRQRLIRQHLTESILVSLAGGAAGLLLATWGVELARAAPLEYLPFWAELGIDGRVLAFALGLTLLTGVGFGIVPALHASRTDITHMIKDGGAGTTSGLRRGRLRSALVVSQIAGAMVLLTGAGLLSKALLRTMRTDLGYSTENLLGADLLLLGTLYDDPARRTLFQERLLEQVQALPGVRAAALSTIFILNWPGVSERGIAVEGVSQELADAVAGRAYAVTPDYFAVLGVQVLRGRGFTAQDRQGAPEVAVMNEAMARRLWPDGDAVGKRIKLGGPASESPWITVVGVVANMRFSPVGGQFPPYLYLPYAQHPMPRPAGQPAVLQVRTAGPPGALADELRAAVLATDAEVVVENVATAEQALAAWRWPFRFNATVLGSVAGFAVLLAVMGIYGVVAYGVRQRTHEIGIRMALGAAALDVLRLVLRDAVRLAAVGIGFGLAGALLLTRVLGALLFGVSATDPLVFAAVAALFGAVALLASLLPARAAARVDPIIALRAK